MWHIAAIIPVMWHNTLLVSVLFLHNTVLICFDGCLQILPGSIIREMLTYIPLDPELQARAIRITPREYEGDIDLKVELYGEPLGTCTCFHAHSCIHNLW